MLYKDVAETIATLIDLSCNNHVDLETDQTFGHKNIRISNQSVERYFTKSRKIIGNILLPNIWLVIRFDLIFITCVSLMFCCFL